MPLDSIDQAAVFAKAAHMAVGQKRKYTGEPYHVHPYTVAQMVSLVGGSANMIKAAYLHDVVEDTYVTTDQIYHEFGPIVGDYVQWLSDLQTPLDGNRAFRKAQERAWLSQAPPEVQTIKLADVIDNTRSIVKHDPSFSRVYLREIYSLLETMNKGTPVLYTSAVNIVRHQNASFISSGGART